MGDFTGFSFDGYSSESLGIIRVSGGDRYDEELHPEINDRAIEVPGLNGQYYFGSDYGTKTIDIEFAFDHLDEQQFRKLRQVFGTKEIKELIFDERPYKYYMAKIENPIELSYVCFDESKRISDTERDGVRVKNRVPITEEVDGETQVIGYTIEREQVTPYKYLETKERIYKGEGKITFICYFPFAKSKFKQLPFHFQLTTDTEIDSNKKYFVYDEVSITFDLVDNPTVEDIETYYERVDDESTQDWAFSSGILSVETQEQNNIDTVVNNEIVVYNAGDISTGFKLYIPKTNLGNNFSIEYVYDNSSLAALNLKQISQWKSGSEVGILIDTDNQLIIGVTNSNTFELSNNLYNEYVSSGFFFKIEPADMDDFNHKLVLTNGTGVQIFYNYLYF